MNSEESKLKHDAIGGDVCVTGELFVLMSVTLNCALFFYCRKNTHIQVQTQTYCKTQIYSDRHTVDKVPPPPALCVVAMPSRVFWPSSVIVIVYLEQILEEPSTII